MGSFPPAPRGFDALWIDVNLAARARNEPSWSWFCPSGSKSHGGASKNDEKQLKTSRSKMPCAFVSPNGVVQTVAINNADIAYSNFSHLAACTIVGQTRGLDEPAVARPGEKMISNLPLDLDVIVWDGDSIKMGSFTRFIPCVMEAVASSSRRKSCSNAKKCANLLLFFVGDEKDEANLKLARERTKEIEKFLEEHVENSQRTMATITARAVMIFVNPEVLSASFPNVSNKWERLAFFRRKSIPGVLTLVFGGGNATVSEMKVLLKLKSVQKLDGEVQDYESYSNGFYKVNPNLRILPVGDERESWAHKLFEKKRVSQSR